MQGPFTGAQRSSHFITQQLEKAFACVHMRRSTYKIAGWRFVFFGKLFRLLYNSTFLTLGHLIGRLPSLFLDPLLLYHRIQIVLEEFVVLSHWVQNPTTEFDPGRYVLILHGAGPLEDILGQVVDNLFRVDFAIHFNFNFCLAFPIILYTRIVSFLSIADFSCQFFPKTGQNFLFKPVTLTLFGAFGDVF